MASSSEILKAQMLDKPALKPPPGLESNFIDPPSHRELSLATLILCLLITTSMTFMRLYVKIFTVHKLHLEDCKCFIGVQRFGALGKRLTTFSKGYCLSRL